MNKDLEKDEQLNSDESYKASQAPSIEEPVAEEKACGQEVNEEKQEKKEKFFDKKFIIFSCVLLAIVSIVVFVNSVLTFMVVVSGSSMKPTFQGGEVLFVNKTVEPERSDIIIVKVMEKTVTSGGSTIQEVWIIKRLIAIPGDTVEIKNGYVYVNGTQLKEEYLSKQGITEDIDWQTKTLAEDEYFYLGDNRGIGQSSDSRDSSKGPCSREDILGVVTESAIKAKGFSKFVYNFTSPLRKLIYNIRGN